MNHAEFDRVADQYALLHRRSIAASGEDPEFFARYKARDAQREAARAGVAVRAVLDFGCGVGNSWPHLARCFPQARLAGADVSRRSLTVARQRFAQLPVDAVEIEDKRLPLDDARFDLVFAACVFHHIDPAEHAHWLGELRRVTRPGGLLMLFEHNPLNPLTVAAVRDCPFDEHAVLQRAGTMRRRVLAAGWQDPHCAYRVFFPRVLSFARPLEGWLARLPLGAQYWVRARRGEGG